MPSGWVGHVNDPSGCHHVDDVAGRERVVQPVRHPAPGHPRGGHPQRRPRWAALRDRQIEYDCRTSSPSMVGAQGEVLAGLEEVVVAQLVRDGEGDGDSVVGEAFHGRDRERVELGAAASDGVGRGSESRGSSERLELVERLAAGPAPAQRLARGRPEPRQLLGVGAAALRAARRASAQGQRHRAHRARRRAARSRTRAARSRPRSLIQSVVQAGRARVRTSQVNPPAGGVPMPVAMASIAGQPEYVGVIVTRT